MATTRNSNLELLRIVAMAFIVIWHISIHAQEGETITHDYVASIAITGVNLFVLISGYFGIRLKWKSLLNILSCAIFYYAVTLLCDYIFFDPTLKLGKEIEGIFTPISNYKTYWFVSTYIMLMLLSPAINAALANIGKRQHIFLIAVMFYLSCVSGFAFKHYVNLNGYCLFNFVFLYSIGNFLNKYDIAEKIKNNRLLIMYAVATIVIFIGSYRDAGRILNYNNPAIILAALSLFCLFAKAKFSNAKINTIARYMFPIYLVQESPLGKEVYKLLHSYGTTVDFQGIIYLATIALYIVALVATAFILEKIRLLILKKPLEQLSNYLTSKYSL